jgi:hypothetical protein
VHFQHANRAHINDSAGEDRPGIGDKNVDRIATSAYYRELHTSRPDRNRLYPPLKTRQCTPQKLGVEGDPE